MEHRYLQVRYERLAAVLDKLLAVEAFTSLWKPGVLVEDRRIEYNTVRPRNVLGYLTPTDYAKAWATIHPEPS